MEHFSFENLALLYETEITYPGTLEKSSVDFGALFYLKLIFGDILSKGQIHLMLSMGAAKDLSIGIGTFRSNF